MDPDSWSSVLAACLGLNALTGVAYRVYRLSKGGPMADVTGQAILGVVLGGLAVATALGASWPRWPALGYALLFGLLVMPVWVLGVLIPLRPGALDYAFTACYWLCLAAIAVAAIAL